MRSDAFTTRDFVPGAPGRMQLSSVVESPGSFEENFRGTPLPQLPAMLASSSSILRNLHLIIIVLRRKGQEQKGEGPRRRYAWATPHVTHASRQNIELELEAT